MITASGTNRVNLELHHSTCNGELLTDRDMEKIRESMLERAREICCPLCGECRNAKKLPLCVKGSWFLEGYMECEDNLIEGFQKYLTEHGYMKLWEFDEMKKTVVK